MKVDYDRVAPTYRARYTHDDYGELETAIRRISASSVDLLEVGCGTGHWLTTLAGAGRRTLGVDPSTEMLHNADVALRGHCVVQGTAEALPFADGAFDFVFAVNAIHHFSDLEAAITEASRVLRPGGRFATVGLDPSTGIDQWYVYDYFPRALALDKQRYPSAARIRAAMESAGFGELSSSLAQHIPAAEPARAYLESPAFHRHTASQLSIQSDAEFEAGVARIWEDIRAGEESGVPALLTADLRLYLAAGQLPEGAT